VLQPIPVRIIQTDRHHTTLQMNKLEKKDTVKYYDRQKGMFGKTL